MNENDHADGCLCGEAPLQPEKSVPLTGFSPELRLADDVERFRFSFALRGDVQIPVHIVFSRSGRAAEVKAADLKVYRVSGVSSACEARERWVAWWRMGHRPASLRIPQRTGRLPIPRPAAS